jgi:hypothetical protein
VPLLVFTCLALAVAVGLGTAVSPWASPHPDGLEKVAGDTGFIDRATTTSVQEGSPIADYAFPGIANERVATGVAGFVGTIGVFLVAVAAAWLLRRRRGASAGAAA